MGGLGGLRGRRGLCSDRSSGTTPHPFSGLCGRLPSAPARPGAGQPWSWWGMDGRCVVMVPMWLTGVVGTARATPLRGRGQPRFSRGCQPAAFAHHFQGCGSWHSICPLQERSEKKVHPPGARVTPWGQGLAVELQRQGGAPRQPRARFPVPLGLPCPQPSTACGGSPQLRTGGWPLWSVHTRQSPEECTWGTRAGPGCPTSLPHPRLDGDWRRVFLLKEFIVPELRLLTVI